jgi:hypothetical protein
MPGKKLEAVVVRVFAPGGRLSCATAQECRAFPLGVALQNCHHKDDPVQGGKLSDSTDRRARRRFVLCFSAVVGLSIRSSRRGCDHTNGVLDDSATAPIARAIFEDCVLIEGVFNASDKALLSIRVISG